MGAVTFRYCEDVANYMLREAYINMYSTGALDEWVPKHLVKLFNPLNQIFQKSRHSNIRYRKITRAG